MSFLVIFPHLLLMRLLFPPFIVCFTPPYLHFPSSSPCSLLPSLLHFSNLFLVCAPLPSSRQGITEDGSTELCFCHLQDGSGGGVEIKGKYLMYGVVGGTSALPHLSLSLSPRRPARLRQLSVAQFISITSNKRPNPCTESIFCRGIRRVQVSS